jgi:hypothetical protein
MVTGGAVCPTSRGGNIVLSTDAIGAELMASGVS